MSEKTEEYPLSPYERGMYIEQRLDPSSTVYNLNIMAMIRGASSESVKTALNSVFAAHEAFRSYYGERDGKPVRIITGCLPEISEAAAKDIAEVIEIAENEDIPFDLTAGIPVRPTVYTLADSSVVLHMAVHHIAFDGVSEQIFHNELTDALRGKPITAASPDLSGLNGCDDQNPKASGLEYYRSVFADGVPVSEMPIKGSRPAIHPRSDRRLTAEYAGAELERIGSAAKKLGVSVFQLFFAAVSMTLGKYTNSEDVVLGVPTNMRPNGAENAIGMFVNTAPVRVRPVREKTVGEYLAEVCAEVRKATRGAGVPFEELVAEFAKDRDPSRSPIFDVSFNYLYEPSVYSDEGITVEMFMLLQRMTRDIVITIRRTKEKLRLYLQYSSELFDDEVAGNFFEQLRYTTDSVCSGSGSTVREVTALPPAQLDRLMKLSTTAAAEPTETVLHRMFEKRAAEVPDKTVLIACDRTMTYRELDESANIAANELIAMGIKPGDSVALLLPRRSCYFRCMFGVLKAGAAFIPCDPQYPPDRINHIIRDSGASFVITTSDKLSDYPAGKALDAEKLLAGRNTSAPAVEVTGDMLAYMIYTSGSTGVPKGVMLTHKGICNYLRPHDANIHMKFIHDNAETYLSITTVSFDMSFKEHTAALCFGITLVFASDEEMNDPKALAGLMKRYGVDCINATPSRLQGYLFSKAFCEELSHCKCVMSGGEGYPIVLRDRIREIAPDARIFNTYGPTEITVSCNGCDITDDDCITVGKPLLNYIEYIVDSFGDPSPYGAAGELYVGGTGVAMGYRNLPEKTAESFVEYRGLRMYRTGDLAKWDSMGRVMILGRLDSQIKLRGLRIELGEIENVIGRFAGIKETAVAVKNIGGTEHLAAYFTAESRIDITALKEYAASKLTHYMVPTAYMQLDEMPHTPNGKKDIRKLPDPVIAESIGSAAARELTRFDRELCELAEKAMGSPVTDIGTSLPELGMTSLTAIAFTTFVEEKYGCEIPTGKILRGLSIAQAEDIIYESLVKGGNAKTAVTKEARRDEYPLSSNQLGIYYEVMKNPEALMYNMPLCYSFESIDADRLKAAVEKAVNCHRYMNTHIAIKNGELMQIRDDDALPDIPIKEMPAEEFGKYRNGFVKPFNLHKDRLYRFEIIRSDGRTYLLSDIHHIIFDGLSRGLFIDTVSKAYDGEAVSDEEYDYFEYALSENNDRNSESYRISEKYFTDMMSMFESVSEIPSDRNGRPEDGNIGTVSAVLQKEPVVAFCKRKSVTPASLFLAAALYTVSRFVNSRNVYISTISGGRINSRIRRTVGMFVHTLPVHICFDEKMSVDDLVKNAYRSMLEGTEHENYPFMQLAYKYGYHTEIMYECQLGVSKAENSIGEAKYTTDYLKLETPKFKVTIAIEDKDGQIAVTIRYNDAIYTEAYMRTLADSVRITAENIIAADSDTCVRTLSLVADEERQRLISLGTSAEHDIPIKILHRVFEQRVSQVPDKTALIACDKTLTYDELNKEANRAAHSLIERNVGRRDSVVLLLPRRSFYFAAVFGVLKSGAAFIPCDPEYPPDRIRHIIGDSGARFIVTTQDHLADYPAERAILIDDLLNNGNASDPGAMTDENDLAYMIYTSGSTGKPKGVMLRHCGISNFVTHHAANILYDTIDKGIDTMLSITTVSFDLALKDSVGVLCSGKTVVFANEDQMNDPRELTRLINENGVDAINATPSRYLQYMLYEPFTEALRGCSLVMAGGERFPDNLMKRLQALGIKNIINTYGPTETTVSANMAYLTDADHVSVGRPLLNYREYIVDSDMNILPRGVIGELLIGGPGVAEGYRGLSEQTAKRFIEYNGERVYRSGDFAKWDEQGNVMILGRMDGQVKLRGLRIELGEIEGLIDKQPHLRKAVVAVKKLNGTDTLCAYYTADCEIEADKLRAELARSLTHYMVPTAYLQLDTIPVTPNGKTDLKALPDPVPVKSGEYSAPNNDTEKYFCELFRNVLNIERVGAADNFFDIGGSSLLVTSVVVDAADHGFEITYGDVFRRPTPRGLAEMFASGDMNETVRIVDFGQYDYSKINELLSHNNMESLCKGETRRIGNILITGATGFMGIHVLYHFLKNESGKAFCLLRKGRYESAAARLKMMFIYYFNEELEEDFDRRVTAFNGDVTSIDSFAALEELPIDTVFNCAANVKHFSSGTDIEDVNVGGALNCVRFCEKKGVRLIHFSTTSVCGASADNYPPITSVLDEQTLYIGQRLDTKYTNSKLLAERIVLEAVAERGLDAKVIRVGTLSARESDGEFQMNFLTNNFMGRLRSYEILGCFPYSMINTPICLGPIDKSVEAFFALAKTPKECCLFNCTNSHTIPLGDIVCEMNKSGIKVDFVEDNVFAKVLDEAKQDPKKTAILSSMIAYQNMAHGKRLVPIRPVNNYTTQALAKMGFFWDLSDERYILSFISALSGLGFFDSTNLSR